MLVWRPNKQTFSPEANQNQNQNPNISAQCARIYIGKLPKFANPEEVLGHFKRFGEIVDFLQPPNEKKAKLQNFKNREEIYRGFAFVTYRDPSSASRAIQNSHWFYGEQVFVTLALPKVKGQKISVKSF